MCRHQRCALLLGCPWQYDRNVTHARRENTYSFVHDGKQRTLKPTQVYTWALFRAGRAKKKPNSIFYGPGPARPDYRAAFSSPGLAHWAKNYQAIRPGLQ
jgi:hypothetical protein